MGVIKLTDGQEAVVDDADLSQLAVYEWRAYKAPRTHYAYRRRMKIDGSGPSMIFMHREILNAPHGTQVDHVNSNGLDNRRGNIRVCSVGENQMNRGVRTGKRSSKFKGVYYKGRNLSKPWKIQINKAGKVIKTQYFKTEDEAGRAYNELAKIYHGGFARLNAVSF